jgi:hypothetical protein
MFGKTKKLRSAGRPAARSQFRGRQRGSLEQLEDRCLLSGVPVDTSLTAEQGAVLVTALDRFVDTAHALDEYDALAAPLPLDLGSLGSRLDMGQILASRLRDRVANYLATDQTRTSAELVQRLRAPAVRSPV